MILKAIPADESPRDTSKMPPGVDVEETEEYVPHEQPWADPGVPLLEDPEVEPEDKDLDENPDVPDEDRGL